MFCQKGKSNYYRNHHTKFEIERTILTCQLMERAYNSGQRYGRTELNYRKASLLNISIE